MLDSPSSDGSSSSDGFHTFDDLYEHRNLLFMALMKSYPEISWRAHFHSDGSGYEGWFIAGMELPLGQITYHLPDSCWSVLDNCGIATTDNAPVWDGHTSADVIHRLADYLANHFNA